MGEIEITVRMYVSMSEHRRPAATALCTVSALARSMLWTGSESNKLQSNSATGGIPVASSPNSAFVFATWQQKFATVCFWLGVQPQNLPFPTSRRWTPHVTLRRIVTSCIYAPRKYSYLLTHSQMYLTNGM